MRYTILRSGRSGSSPHTRGALRGLVHRQHRPVDHPRIRGEHDMHQLLDASSMWIIPAYAGSTFSVPLVTALDMGSSPHTRGAPSERGRGACWCQDHPRIRGEHAIALSRWNVALGIIPAYAGSTRFFGKIWAKSVGSSPHTRGAHLTTCATIPHSSTLDSVIRVHSRINTQPQPRCYPPNLLAARYLLALLHPVCGIPSIVASSVPSGLFINSTPSQSTGCQSG